MFYSATKQYFVNSTNHQHFFTAKLTRTKKDNRKLNKSDSQKLYKVHSHKLNNFFYILKIKVTVKIKEK